MFACIWQTHKYLKKKKKKGKKKKVFKSKEKKKKREQKKKKEKQVFFFPVIALACGDSHPGEVTHLRPEPKETADVRN